MNSDLVKWFMEQGVKQLDRDTISKLTVKSLLFIAVMLLITYFSVKMWWRDRELARLRHELDVKEEEEIRAKVRAVLDTSDAHIAEHEAAIALIRKSRTLVQKDIKEIEKFKAEQEEKIDAIKNWEDVDKYLDSVTPKP